MDFFWVWHLIMPYIGLWWEKTRCMDFLLSLVFDNMSYFKNDGSEYQIQMTFFVFDKIWISIFWKHVDIFSKFQKYRKATILNYTKRMPKYHRFMTIMMKIILFRKAFKFFLWLCTNSRKLCFIFWVSNFNYRWSCIFKMLHMYVTLHCI